MTFKGEQFDISVEGDSPHEIVTDFIKTKEEIENAFKPVGGRKLNRKSGSREHGAGIENREVEQAQEISLSDLSIPQPVKDAFVERKDKLSNWDAIFLLLRHHSSGLTNKQLRSLAEEIGKPIKFSWFDSEFHRRDNEGLVMSRRQTGTREALYFLTEPGKRAADTLIREIQAKQNEQTGLEKT